MARWQNKREQLLDKGNIQDAQKLEPQDIGIEDPGDVAAMKMI